MVAVCGAWLCDWVWRSKFVVRCLLLGLNCLSFVDCRLFVVCVTVVCLIVCLFVVCSLVCVVCCLLLCVSCFVMIIVCCLFYVV